jgi:hypothetical protein
VPAKRSRATKTSRESTQYGIEIGFPPKTPEPSRIFRAMGELIESTTHVDKDLAKRVDTSIETMVLLREIESGSIRAWLELDLFAFEDATTNPFWKDTVSEYLLNAKFFW